MARNVREGSTIETEKRNVLQDVTSTMKEVDRQLVLRLTKNPLESVKLTEQQWIYGLLGLASAFVGYLVWSLLIASSINEMINGLFGFGGLGGSSVSTTGAIMGRLMLIGLVSTFAILAAIYLIGWWRSGAKPQPKAFIAKVGGAYYIGAIGFLLATLVTFLSGSFGFLVLIITLLSLLVLGLQAGAEATAVPRQALASYLILSVASYLVLISLLLRVLL